MEAGAGPVGSPESAAEELPVPSKLLEGSWGSLLGFRVQGV